MSSTDNNITITLDGDDQFSNELKVTNYVRYHLKASASPDFEGTVTLQGKYKDSQDWIAIGTFTDSKLDHDYYPSSTIIRVGILSGDYTSGSIEVYIDGERG